MRRLLFILLVVACIGIPACDFAQQSFGKNLVDRLEACDDI